MKISAKLYPTGKDKLIEQGVFISCPMAGKTDEEIKETRKRAEMVLRELGYTTLQIIDLRPQVQGVNPLWYLARSLNDLATANIIYFAEGWDCARGCLFEWEAFIKYQVENGVKGFAEVNINGEIELVDASRVIPNSKIECE